MSGDPSYPDDVTGPQVCMMEGCLGNGHCSRCGQVNYQLLGYYGAIARWAKAWDVSKEEAEQRFYQPLDEAPHEHA